MAHGFIIWRQCIFRNNPLKYSRASAMLESNYLDLITICLYRCDIQTNDKFQNFILKMEINFENKALKWFINTFQIIHQACDKKNKETHEIQVSNVDSYFPTDPTYFTSSKFFL